MNKSGKIALIALLTVACGVGGYFATDALENNTGGGSVGTNVSGNFSEDVNTGGNINTSAAETTRETVIEETETEINELVNIPAMDSDIVPAITSVSKPVYNASSNKYTFNVTADGQDLKYVLTSNNGTILKTQDSGVFTVDPVPNTGRYLVYVSNTSGTKSEIKTVSGCIVVYEKLTATQIQTAFNSGDYMEGDKLDFKNRIARNCTYSYTNLNEGDDKASSFSEIFNRIQLSSWKSVTVNNVSYDQASNQVANINMTINY